jgi:hypothetical protein
MAFDRSRPPTREIRFLRHAADRCSLAERAIPDRLVCDTIANGVERPLGGGRDRKGPVSRFGKTFSRHYRRRSWRETIFVVCGRIGDAWVAFTAYAVKRGNQP